MQCSFVYGSSAAVFVMAKQHSDGSGFPQMHAIFIDMYCRCWTPYNTFKDTKCNYVASILEQTHATLYFIPGVSFAFL